jgi:hypothetical protein
LTNPLSWEAIKSDKQVTPKIDTRKAAGMEDNIIVVVAVLLYETESQEVTFGVSSVKPREGLSPKEIRGMQRCAAVCGLLSPATKRVSKWGKKPRKFLYNKKMKMENDGLLLSWIYTWIAIVKIQSC